MNVHGYCRADEGLDPIETVCDAMRSAETDRVRVLVVAPSHAHLPGLMDVAAAHVQGTGPGVALHRAIGAQRVIFDHGGSVDFRAATVLKRREGSDDIESTGYDMVFDIRPRERVARDAIDNLISTRTRLVSGGFAANAVDAVLLSAAQDAGTI